MPRNNGTLYPLLIDRVMGATETDAKEIAHERVRRGGGGRKEGRGMGAVATFGWTEG